MTITYPTIPVRLLHKTFDRVGPLTITVDPISAPVFIKDCIFRNGLVLAHHGSYTGRILFTKESGPHLTIKDCSFYLEDDS